MATLIGLLWLLLPQVITGGGISGAGPSIQSLSPSSGVTGTTVVITGQNLGTTQGSSTVTVNGTVATATGWAPTQVTITVPGGATTGNVVVTVNSLATNGILFTVTDPPPASSTVYVATNGDDARSCVTAQTITTPRLTIAQGAACLTPNLTLLVRAGTYTENLTNAVPSGSSWIAPVRVAAYPGETVTIRPSSGAHVLSFTQNNQYIEFDGINIDGAFTTSSSLFIDDTAGGVPHHLRFQNADIHGREGIGQQSAAIDVGGHDHEFTSLVVHGTGGPMAFNVTGDTNTIASCSISAVSYVGIQIYRAAGSPTGNIVKNTRVHHIAESYFFGAAQTQFVGIFVGGPSTQVYNNLIDNNTVAYQARNAAIFVFSGSNSLIANNTLYNNTTDAIVVDSGATTTTVTNNIFYANTTNTVTDTGTGTVQASNLEGTNPQFVNAGAADFRLLSVSPAINAGTANSLTTDFEAAPRPSGAAIDQGAYEYHAPTLTSLTPATGAVGSSVVIAGTNFGATQGASAAFFQTGPATTTAATVTSWSATSLTVTVPASAVTGSVSVTVSAVASNSLTYTVTGGTGPIYYIAPPSSGGLDSRSCSAAMTIGTPKATLANAAANCLTPGSTLYLRAGTYAENILNTIPSGTSWTNKVRIANYPGETVYLQPSGGTHAIEFNQNQAYIEFDGINIISTAVSDAGIYLNDNAGGIPHHIRFQNADVHHREGAGQTNAAFGVGGHDDEFIYLTVHGSGGPYAFYINGDNHVVDHCDIYGVSLAGIQIFRNGGPLPNGNTVSNTRIHHITQSYFFGAPDPRLWGILVLGTNNVIFNNVIDHNTLSTTRDNGSTGIGVAYTGNKLYNNTIYGNTTKGIVVDGSALGTFVVNNLVYGNDVDVIENNGVSTTKTTNTEGVNPLFVNAAAFNFQLAPGSPAANVGTTNTVAPVDILGIARPQGAAFDVGAYERVP